MTSNFRYDKFINDERSTSEKIINYNNYLKSHLINKEYAKFESKTDKINEIKSDNFERKKYKNQKENFLDIRKKKLSELLMQENNIYHQELINNLDTPEQNKKRMEQKLNELKKLRQIEHEKIITKIANKKFYDEADELRKNDSEYNNFACHLEQENQMIDKLKQRVKERKIEDAFTILNNLDYEKKIEREKKEEKEIKEKNKKNVEYIEWQKNQQKEALKHANEINEKEKIRLREQWKKDEENEKKNAYERLMLNKQVNADIKEFNEREEKNRNELIQKEKNEDKKMINDIINKEKALDEIDRLNKIKKIKDFEKNKQFLEYKMNQQKENEMWMDKLAAEEAEKQYQKEQEKWLKNEAARIELMKQVYEDRAKSLLNKKNLEEIEKKNILKEREILDNEIKKYNEKVEQLKREEKEKKVLHQGELKYQMKLKQDKIDKEHQQELYERRMSQLWEKEYQDKLNEQKKLHMERLAKIKAQNNLYQNDVMDDIQKDINNPQQNKILNDYKNYPNYNNNNNNNFDYNNYNENNYYQQNNNNYYYDNNNYNNNYNNYDNNNYNNFQQQQFNNNNNQPNYSYQNIYNKTYGNKFNIQQNNNNNNNNYQNLINRSENILNKKYSIANNNNNNNNNYQPNKTNYSQNIYNQYNNYNNNNNYY